MLDRLDERVGGIVAVAARGVVGRDFPFEQSCNERHRLACCVRQDHVGSFPSFVNFNAAVSKLNPGGVRNVVRERPAATVPAEGVPPHPRAVVVAAVVEQRVEVPRRRRPPQVWVLRMR